MVLVVVVVALLAAVPACGVAAVPGWHWWYHALILSQVNPEGQHHPSQEPSAVQGED